MPRTSSGSEETGPWHLRGRIIKVPVLGLGDRQGQVYLIVYANVQTEPIQPLIEGLVRCGATVYCDA